MMFLLINFSIVFPLYSFYETKSEDILFISDGTEDAPYLIEDVHDLQAIRENPNAHYVLEGDIDASETRQWNDGKGFEPIGSSNDTFDGTLDGKGYEISGLYIDRPDAIYVGLFGLIGEQGAVKDVGIVDVDISGSYLVGGVAGSLRGEIHESYVTGNVSVIEGHFGLDAAGGLVGTLFSYAKISRTYTSGVVRGVDNVGGLIGKNHGSSVYHSYSESNVKGTSWYIGGLIGHTRSGNVHFSYATGDVSGGGFVGGLIGKNGAVVSQTFATGDVNGNLKVGGLIGENRGTLADIYARGSVTGERIVGGLIGENLHNLRTSYSTGILQGNQDTGGLIGKNTGRVEDSFWDIESSGIEISDGGTGKTTDEMKSVATFTDISSKGLNEPWDFINSPYDDERNKDIWTIDESERINDGYPYFSWTDEERTRPFTYIWVILAVVILFMVYLIYWYQRKVVKKTNGDGES